MNFKPFVLGSFISLVFFIGVFSGELGHWNFKALINTDEVENVKYSNPQLWSQAWAEVDEDIPVEQLQELSEIFYYIKKRYVEDVESQTLIENAMRGMVSALDPHSAYLSEADLQNFHSGLSGEEYGGVGIYVGEKNDFVEVISPIYDTPAYRADIKSGDIILKIDDISTQGLGIEKAVERMRGKVDTILVIELLSAATGDIRTIELVREKIVTPSVIASLLDNGYGYLRITRFQSNTLEDLTTALNGMYEQNETALKGIMIDMRNNPGGYLEASIGVAAAFLPLGAAVVSDKGRDEENNSTFIVQDEHLENLANREDLVSVPLVVLVNNGSASASEIVAGALQDHQRGVIVGQRTYGKASVQSVFPLRSSNQKTALRLTMARYYTPSGRNIQSRGIEPDIEVAPVRPNVTEEEEGFSMRESNLESSLENTGDDSKDSDDAEADSDGKPKLVPTPNQLPTRPPFVDEDDYQYSQAMIILKAIGITKPTALSQ